MSHASDLHLDIPRVGAKDPGEFRIAVEESAWPASGRPPASTWTEVHGEAPPTSTTVRIQATDLRGAAKAASAARQSSGQEPTSVLLDIEVFLNESPALARQDLAEMLANSPQDPEPTTLLYVGTARGLASLLSDIHTLGLTDGATLLTHPSSETPRRFFNEVLSYMNKKDLLAAQAI